MIKGLVSIVTPCYNGEKYIDRYFNGFLKQTYNKFEIIFVDDGSIDKTKDIVMKYKEELKKKNVELKYVYQENSGQAAAINKALPYISGEYIYWIDSDDYCEYDAIQSMVYYLEENKDCNFVRGKVAYRRSEKIDEIVRIGEPKNTNAYNIFNDYVFERNVYCFAGIFMVRMKCFDKYIKNRKIYVSRAGQNWQLILPIAYNEKCAFLDKIICNIVIRENSHSHSIKGKKFFFEAWKQHEEILNNVISCIDNMPGIKKIMYRIMIKIKYIKLKLRRIIAESKMYNCIKRRM